MCENRSGYIRYGKQIFKRSRTQTFKGGNQNDQLGYLIFNDGVEQETSENAKILLQNGVSFELVRKSIHHISDEALQTIYDEVMALQNK